MRLSSLSRCGTRMDARSKRALMAHEEFRPLIRRYGMPAPAAQERPFPALASAIIYQQISGAAAASIMKRFRGLYAGRMPTPRTLAETSAETLRTAGISPQKARYLHDLARHFSDGTIRERDLATMTNEEIIRQLTRIKGVGVWTVHMFLLFTVRRPDILPTGDLGIKKGFRAVYRLRKLPTHAQMERIARPWRAHASLASWYLWRAADEEKRSKREEPERLKRAGGLRARVRQKGAHRARAARR